MIDYAVGAAIFWAPAFFIGRYMSRYVARQVAEELRLLAFGRPQDDPRRR